LATEFLLKRNEPLSALGVRLPPPPYLTEKFKKSIILYKEKKNLKFWIFPLAGEIIGGN